MLLYFFVDEETISQEKIIEEIFEKMWRFVNVVLQLPQAGTLSFAFS